MLSMEFIFVVRFFFLNQKFVLLTNHLKIWKICLQCITELIKLFLSRVENLSDLRSKVMATEFVTSIDEGLSVGSDVQGLNIFVEDIDQVRKYLYLNSK